MTSSPPSRGATGHDWVERRDKALALNEASKALHELEPEHVSVGRQLCEDSTRGRGHEQLVREAGTRHPRPTTSQPEPNAVRRRRGRSVRLAQRPPHARPPRLAQAFQKEDGRLWLIATGQETLEDVVGALGDKRVELARVGTVSVTVDLVPERYRGGRQQAGAREEPGRRESRTRGLRPQPQPAPRERNARQSTRGDEFTGEEFIRVYPLLPYHIQLFIDAVSGLRAHGGAGPMVGGANRTLIRLAHQLVKTALADLPVGHSQPSRRRTTSWTR